MNQHPITPKFTYMIVKEMEKLTGKPVSAQKRCELQSFLMQWYYSVKEKEKKQ